MYSKIRLKILNILFYHILQSRYCKANIQTKEDERSLAQRKFSLRFETKLHYLFVYTNPRCDLLQIVAFRFRGDGTDLVAGPLGHLLH